MKAAQRKPVWSHRRTASPATCRKLRFRVLIFNLRIIASASSRKASHFRVENVYSDSHSSATSVESSRRERVLGSSLKAELSTGRTLLPTAIERRFENLSAAKAAHNEVQSLSTNL